MTFFSMRFVPGALLGTLALVSPTGAAAQDEPDETSPAVEYRQSLISEVVTGKVDVRDEVIQ